MNPNTHFIKKLQSLPKPTKKNMTLQKTPLKPNNTPLLAEPEDEQGPESGRRSDEKFDIATASAAVVPEESGRERLKRHRVSVAGQVWIPEKWGKEELLKDWIDGSAFESSLFSSGILSARRALITQGKRSSPNNNAAATAAAGALTILNSC